LGFADGLVLYAKLCTPGVRECGKGEGRGLCHAPVRGGFSEATTEASKYPGSQGLYCGAAIL